MAHVLYERFSLMSAHKFETSQAMNTVVYPPRKGMSRAETPERFGGNLPRALDSLPIVQMTVETMEKYWICREAM
jgi:hypothetical protein